MPTAMILIATVAILAPAIVWQIRQWNSERTRQAAIRRLEEAFRG